MTGLKVKQLTANIGPEIGGIQIGDEYSDDTIAERRSLLLEHLWRSVCRSLNRSD